MKKGNTLNQILRFTSLFLASGAIGLLSCCKQGNPSLTAQQIIDKSIEASGGNDYGTSDFSFRFRDRVYTSTKTKTGRRLTRELRNDSTVVLDIREGNTLKRFINDTLVTLADSLANSYSNSVNSVHYFAYLPYGLNDRAVNKQLLGTVNIKGREHYKIRVTFDKDGGGKDYEDVYVYWVERNTFKTNYLAYIFHTDGGGLRFREAYNERRVNGIRFVDYLNYEPKDTVGVQVEDLDSLYMQDGLKLLSKIELEDISVVSGNYN